MTIYHRHHIVPKHAGGDDHKDNIVVVTLKEHAELHYERWVLVGETYDKIAWQMLSGQISKAQAIKDRQRESGRKAGLLGKNKPKSLEHNLKNALSQRGNKHAKNRIWMHDLGGKHIRVKSEDVQSLIHQGYIIGRLLYRDSLSGQFVKSKENT